MMTKQKNNVSAPEGDNRATQARGGVPGEDRSKDLTSDQSGDTFGNQQEDKAAAEKKTSGERKR